MADINFEEHCPCGTTVKISGYTSEVRAQIQTWKSIHNKHMNAIAKQIALNWKWPLYNVMPGSFTHESGLGAQKEES